MYTQQTIIRKIRSNFTGRTIKIGFLIFLVFICIYGIYVLIKKYRVKNFENKKNRFMNLLYPYALEKFAMKDDSKIQYYLDNFKMTDVLLTKADVGEANDEGEWSFSTSTFGSVINTVASLMVQTIVPQTTHYASEKIWKIIKHTIRTVAQKLPTTPRKNVLPWGTNWYQFSITYPLFLVAAVYMHRKIFNKDDEMMTRHLSSYISNYFFNPEKPEGFRSMGWLRDGPNAVMMAVPYIGGHLFMNDMNDKSTGMKYVSDYVDLKFVTSGNGFYSDASVVFHTHLRAFGYILSSLPDFILVSKYFENLKTVQAISNALQKTEHPTLKVHKGSWFTRGSTNASDMQRYGTLGFYVFDHIRGVVAKTKDWYIAFNGQHPNLCYYESDQINSKGLFAWVMHRDRLTKNSSVKLYPETTTYVTGSISYDHRLVHLLSDTSTTQTHMPNAASCSIVQIGECVAMSNYYDIQNNVFKIEVHELTLVTKNGLHCMFKIKPDNSIVGESPLRVSAYYGKSHINNSMTSAIGVGVGYNFFDAVVFVYDSVNRIEKQRINDPEIKSGKLDALIISPVQNSSEWATTGFSQCYDSSKVNEMITQPTMNLMNTTDITVIQSQVFKDLLIMYDKKTHFASISIDMGLVYRSSFSLAKNDLDTIFPNGYKALNGELIGKAYVFNCPNGQKFQANFKNVEKIFDDNEEEE